MPANEGYPHARLVIDRALALDPRHADAYATSALIRVNYDRDWGGGAADIAKAQEFGGSRITYLPAGKIAGATGKMARAAELYEAQLTTDPMDGESLRIWVGSCIRLSGGMRRLMRFYDAPRK